MRITVKELKEYKAKLHESSSKELVAFEKSVLGLACLILFLGFCYLIAITNKQTIRYIGFFEFSCFMEVLAIVFIVSSYLASAQVSNVLSTMTTDVLNDENIEDGVDAPVIKQSIADTFYASLTEVHKKAKYELKNFRILALLSFITGVTLLIAFIELNSR